MINEIKLRQIIGFIPHEKQELILHCDNRDIVICAGRRFGKSAICAYLALRLLLEDNKKIWIVAPTFDLSQKVFDYVVKWFHKVAPSQAGGVSMRPNPKIRTARGSTLECKSTENPKGLLGEELDLLIIDEAAQVPEDVYETYLYPTTSSRKGKTIFISTPFGKNWFYRKWLEVKADNGAFLFSSLDGVTVDKAEFERARLKLPEGAFKQNYLATFLDSGVSAFRGIREIISKDCYEDVKAERSYVLGVDLAKYNDFTVLCVLDTYSHKLVHFERFNEVSWTLQKGRIVALARRYNHAKVVIDGTGVGDPIAEDLSREMVLVDNFKLSNPSKEKLIEKLSMFIEQKAILIPDEKILLDELEAFSFEMTDSQNIRYAAPQGFHDDAVIALALAVWGLQDPKLNNPDQMKKPRAHVKYQYL